MMPPSTLAITSSPAPGQQLNQVSAGGEHALIPVHQHPQAAGCGNLLRFHEIRRQILGNFTRPAALRCLHTAPSYEGPGSPSACPHGPQPLPHPAFRPCAGEGLLRGDPPSRGHFPGCPIPPAACPGGRRPLICSVTLEPSPFRALPIMEHARQRPSQGRCGHRKRPVNLPGPFRQFP